MDRIDRPDWARGQSANRRQCLQSEEIANMVRELLMGAVAPRGAYDDRPTPEVLPPEKLSARLHLFQQSPFGDRLPDPRHLSRGRTAGLFADGHHSRRDRSAYPAEGSNAPRPRAPAHVRRGWGLLRLGPDAGRGGGKR